MKEGGQDAAESNDTCLVVADGVGGYAKYGIDPADYARELSKVALKTHVSDPSMNSKGLLDKACNDAKKFKGGATATVLRLKDGMKLESAVIGDAGFMVFGVNEADTVELKYKSPSYQKAFNAPY